MDISVMGDLVAAASGFVEASSHSSSSSSDGGWIPLLFLLTGPAFFMFQYQRYRNTDKRHHHETETLSEVADMQGIDQPVRSITGASNSRMSGANEREVRG